MGIARTRAASARRGDARDRIDGNRLAALWASGATLMEICDALGALQTDVQRVAREMGLSPKPRAVVSDRAPDPTEAEIEERCAAIQRERWTDDDRMGRWCGNGIRHWAAPVIDDRDVSQP